MGLASRVPAEMAMLHVTPAQAGRKVKEFLCPPALGYKNSKLRRRPPSTAPLNIYVADGELIDSTSARQ